MTSPHSSSNQRKRNQFETGQQKWEAVRSCDFQADGIFFYSVQSTGVYCRPSCPSRLPLRKNVTFYASCEEAEREGFRACKRCQPRGATLSDGYAQLVLKACQILEQAEEIPQLKELARQVGMSPFHFHRIFKKMIGLSPKGFAMARRAERIRNALPRSHSVTEAIYQAGYSSNGRFYAESSQALGMEPKTFRNGGRGMAIRFAIGECSLGVVLVASSERGVCAILIGKDPEVLTRDLEERFPKAQLLKGSREFARVIAKVVALVEEPHKRLRLPLDIYGTAFQQRVWQALGKIPIGATASYREIAQRIGMPKAVRAVAAACGANPLAIAIPCHRVVLSDGSLSGYRWGVERKRILLDREKGEKKQNKRKG